MEAAADVVASKGKDTMSLGERKALAAISGYAEPPGTGNVDFAVDVPTMLKTDGSTAYVSSVENVDGRLMLTLSTGARVDVSEVSFQNADAAAIFRAAMDYDTDTAAALIVNYEGDIPSDVYTEAFQNLYEGDKAGLSFSKAAAGNAYSQYLSDGAASAAYQAGSAVYAANQDETASSKASAHEESREGGQAANSTASQGGTSDNVLAFGEGGEVAYDAGSQAGTSENVLAFGEGGEVTSDQSNPSVTTGQSLSVDEESGYNEGETAQKEGTIEDTGETFSPINPGTLSDEVASTFRSSTYTKRVLTEDTVFYRVYGGNAEIAGNYMSRTPQMGRLQSQLDLALVPEWGNTATYVTKVIVPKGTVIYEGFAAPQTINGGAGMIMGGGSQIYIPEARLNPSWFGK